MFLKKLLFLNLQSGDFIDKVSAKRKKREYYGQKTTVHFALIVTDNFRI